MKNRYQPKGGKIGDTPHKGSNVQNMEKAIPMQKCKPTKDKQMEYIKCSVCKKSSVCKYKERVQEIYRHLFPLKVECEMFEDCTMLTGVLFSPIKTEKKKWWYK